MKKAVFMILLAFLFILTGCAGGVSTEPKKYSPENAKSKPDVSEKTDPSAEGSNLREVYPEYFSLDASKGLDVIVWQMAAGSYSFALFEHSEAPRDRLDPEWMKLAGTSSMSAKETYAVLSSYDIVDEDVYIVPWQNPLSSYIPECWINMGNEDMDAKMENYKNNVKRMIYAFGPAHVTLPLEGPCKQYKWEKPGFGGDFIIVLYDDGRYTYYVGMFSSYIGIGTWAYEGSVIVLTEDKALCGSDYVFRFVPSSNGSALFYIADGSDKFGAVDVQDGDAFHLINTIPWDEARYTPDYNSTSTLHADDFLKKLKKDGYHQGDEIRKDYNTGNIQNIYNITPQGISEEAPDLEIFLVKDAYHCFMMYKGEIYRYETFGGYHHRLVLWDYDGNGVKDLVSYHSWGSGVSYLSVDVTDLSTMQTLPVISRGVLWEPEFTFAFDGESVYIDGEKLTYSDGAFHCGDLI